VLTGAWTLCEAAAEGGGEEGPHGSKPGIWRHRQQGTGTMLSPEAHTTTTPATADRGSAERFVSFSASFTSETTEVLQFTPSSFFATTTMERNATNQNMMMTSSNTSFDEPSFSYEIIDTPEGISEGRKKEDPEKMGQENGGDDGPIEQTQQQNTMQQTEYSRPGGSDDEGSENDEEKMICEIMEDIITEQYIYINNSSDEAPQPPFTGGEPCGGGSRSSTR